MSRIFINYRRADSEGYVGRLYDHLCQHFEVESIFMDVTSIEPGRDFVKELEAAVAGCDVFLAIVGPQWYDIRDENGERRLAQWNDFVRLEIASALQQEKLVIPVLVGGAKMPPFSELSEDIAGLTRRQAVALTHQHFGRDALRLIETIKSASPKRAAVKPPTDSESTRAKAAALRQVRDDLVNATTSPLYQYRIDNRYFPVLGDGNPDANILFIGESPGKTEAETGVPFRGPSGEVLEEMLRTVGLKREDVYVTNLLLDRPPNREPLPAEIEFYAPFVERILDIIQPSVIAPLGRFAATALLKKLDLPEKRSKISELHGKLIKSRMPYGEVHILPLYHPAVVLYSMSQKETLRKDFEKLKLFI